MEFATPIPFLRIAFERATHDVRGLCELARASLRSPGVDVVLVRLVRLPRSLRLGMMWADADAVVDCVADAIDAYRLTQDESYDVSDPDAEVAELDRLDAEYEASLDGAEHAVPFHAAERDAEDDRLWRITRQTGPRDLADALVGDLAWVETADDSTGANARPVHFLLGSVGPVWRPLDREAREKLARDSMRDIRGEEDEWGVPDRLSVARIRAGLSRAQAARQLGEDMISVGDLRDLEEGYVVATLHDLLAKLADLYDVSVEWLRGESAPSPMRADVERSGLSETDKAKLGDALHSMAPGDKPGDKRMNLCHTCQTRPVLHEALSGGWFVECPGCGDATADHDEVGDAVEAWNRNLIRLPVEASRAAVVEKSQEELAGPLPCPFCGDPHLSRSRYGDGDEFALIECGTCGGQYDGRWADGWEEWNRRATTLSDEDLARLEKIREAIGFMQRRLEQGQGTRASASCRLSLTMSLDLLRMAERGVVPANGATEQPVAVGAVAIEPDPDGWRDVADVTLDEWRACPWWEWRYSATAGHGLQSSRETQSVPVLGQVRPAPLQSDDSDGWRDVATITLEEWAAWRWWEWRHSDRARALGRSDGRGPHPQYGQSRRVPLLEWPEMAGERWTDAADITQAMIDAWPWWEVDRGDFVAVVPGAGVTVSGALAGQWRPLRLPGMSADPATIGEIAGEDMTQEHFERVREWEWLEPRNKWAGWALGMRGIHTLSGADTHTRWRPAVFGLVCSIFATAGAPLRLRPSVTRPTRAASLAG